MLVTSKDVKISTCVYLASVDTSFDLETIFNYIEIDDKVLGIKYHNMFKGDIKRTGSFFNQASLKIFVAKLNKETNLKVFGNGLFQITGVKNNSQALHTIKIFLESVVNIKGTHLKPISVDKGIILDKSDVEKMEIYDRFNFVKIYKKEGSKFSLLGKKKQKEYIIDGKKVDFCSENRWFVDIGHTDFIKNIYNVNGEYIGYYKFNMVYKRKNLILHNCTYDKIENTDENHVKKEVILNKYKRPLGERHLYLERSTTQEEYPGIKEIEIEYRAIQSKEIEEQIISKEIYKNFKEKIELKVSNINCNFEINLGGVLLNKNAVHNIYSTKYKTLSYYKADSKYQGINVKLFYDKDMEIVEKTDYEYKFTILIFQNGKVIISGCTNRLQIIEVKNFIMKSFNENYEDIVIKNENIKIDNEDLSIWDIM